MKKWRVLLSWRRLTPQVLPEQPSTTIIGWQEILQNQFLYDVAVFTALGNAREGNILEATSTSYHTHEVLVPANSRGGEIMAW